MCGSGITLAQKVADSFQEHVPLSVFRISVQPISGWMIGDQCVGARKESYSMIQKTHSGRWNFARIRSEGTLNAMAISVNAKV